MRHPLLPLDRATWGLTILEARSNARAGLCQAEDLEAPPESC